MAIMEEDSSNNNKENWNSILKYYSSKKFIQNKYNHLLTTLILIFIIEPIIDFFRISYPLGSIIFILSIVLTLKVTVENKKTFDIVTLLVLTTFVFYILSKNNIFTNKLKITMILLCSLAFTAVLGISCIIHMRRLIIEKIVKEDTIKGGICVYFLLGLTWAQIYSIIQLLDQNAFISTYSLNIKAIDFQYYSFTVLTTLGFGDIIPINKLAINLTSLESISGQMFSAIFIARLIGLYAAQKINKN